MITVLAYAPFAMISEIQIRNFKSIRDLTLKTGRVTVLIGENGSGKSNILEAIAFAAGAAANKLDNEFLANRGIRVAEDKWMRSAFPEDDDGEQFTDQNKKRAENIQLVLKGAGLEPIFECDVRARKIGTDRSFRRWVVSAPVWQKEVDAAFQQTAFAEEIAKALEDLKTQQPEVLAQQTLDSLNHGARREFEQALRRMLANSLLRARKRAQLGEKAGVLGLADFMIYAPENATLRTPPPESAIQPLGTKGEGLIKLLQSFSDPKSSDHLSAMKENLRLFGWFDDLLAPDEAATAEARLQIRDRWLAPDRAVFDQRSANEGFLYLLFYFALLMSKRTPRFFALDNLDTALNPKLCSILMEKITELANQNGKQVICTTHNPAILDGLNLNDEEQRLYTVGRDSAGHTTVRRVHAPRPQPGEMPVRLSEAFMRGLIGGLPDNF
jgi:predicted ATPase